MGGAPRRSPFEMASQDAESGERVGVANLERPFAYLRRLMSDTPDAGDKAITTKR